MDEEGEQEKKEEKEGGVGRWIRALRRRERRKAGGFWRTFSVG